MRYIFILFYSIFCTQVGFAQKQNNTFVTLSHIQIDFNSGQPILNRTFVQGKGGAASTGNNSSAVSDANGKLLFYTDGVDVWNKSKELIQGSPINILTNPTRLPTNAVIIPKALEKNKYLIISYFVDRNSKSLNYAEIDMNANNRMGMITRKNVLIDNDISRRLVAIGAADCGGIWLVTNQLSKTNFKSYKFTNEGVEAPIYSKVDLNLPTIYEIEDIAVSPNGKYIATSAFNYLYDYLYKFNNQTGKIDPNSISLTNKNKRYSQYKEFSSDSKNLYVNSIQTDLINNREYYKYNLHRFDVSIFDSTAINKSATVIESINGYKDDIYGTEMILAPNKKIYTVRDGFKYLYATNFYAGELINSNKNEYPTKIVDSVFLWNSIPNYQAADSLPATTFFSYNYLRNYYEHLPKLVLPTKFCTGDSITLMADTAYASTRYKWFVNDTLVSTAAQPKIKLTTVGKQNITLHINECLVEQDLEVSPSLVPILKDTSLCEAQPINLTAPPNGNKYLWNTNETSPSIAVASGGKYQVTVSNTCNQITDQAVVMIHPKFYDFLNPTTEVCELDQIQLTATLGASNYLWNTGDTTQSISVTQAGNYTIKLANRCYSRSDSTQVVFYNQIYKTTAQNLITDNGDEKNAALELFTHPLPGYTLSIYNRWGARVFVTHNSLETWKPTDVESGVYYYNVTADYCGGKPYEQKGWVQVVR